MCLLKYWTGFDIVQGKLAVICVVQRREKKHHDLQTVRLLGIVYAIIIIRKTHDKLVDKQEIQEKETMIVTSLFFRSPIPENTMVSVRVVFFPPRLGTKMNINTVRTIIIIYPFVYHSRECY